MEERGVKSPYEKADATSFSFDVNFFRKRSLEEMALVTRSPRRRIKRRVFQTGAQFASHACSAGIPQYKPSPDNFTNSRASSSSCEPMPFRDSRSFVPVPEDGSAAQALTSRHIAQTWPYSSRVFNRRALEDPNVGVNSNSRKGPAAQAQPNDNNQNEVACYSAPSTSSPNFCEPASHDSNFTSREGSVVSDNSSSSKRIYQAEEEKQETQDQQRYPRRRLRYEPHQYYEGTNDFRYDDHLGELPFPKEIQRYYHKRVHEFAVAERARLRPRLQAQIFHRACSFELKLLDEEAKLLGDELAKGTFDFPNE